MLKVRQIILAGCPSGVHVGFLLRRNGDPGEQDGRPDNSPKRSSRGGYVQCSPAEGCLKQLELQRVDSSFCISVDVLPSAKNDTK